MPICLRREAVARREDLRHLHRLHALRARLPHGRAGDGAGHRERRQAGGLVTPRRGEESIISYQVISDYIMLYYMILYYVMLCYILLRTMHGSWVQPPVIWLCPV